MKPSAILSLLWERHLDPLDHFLADYGSTTIITPAGNVSERLRAIAAAHGAPVATLESFLPVGYHSVVAATPLVAKLSEHLATSTWPALEVDDSHRDSLRLTIEKRIASDVHPVVQLLDCLATIQQVNELVLYVTSEDVTTFGRAAAVWAAAHGVPSLQVAHSLALVDPYTVHAHLLTDKVAVYGERGAEGYLDLGIDRHRIVVTGNPAWDRYAHRQGQREQIREDLVQRYDLDATLPLVVFGTTWSGRFSASDTGNSYAATLRDFVAACEELAEAGTLINAVIKDRPANERFGRRALDDAIAQVPLVRQRYTHATGDTERFAAGADVLVAVDSNYLVEAMLVGTPVINLVGSSAVPMAAPFEEASGVVEAEPDQLAARIRELIEDPEYRRARLAQIASRIAYYNLGAADGQSACRVGHLMADMARNEPAPEPPRSFLIRAGRHGIRVVRRVLGRPLRYTRAIVRRLRGQS